MLTRHTKWAVWVLLAGVFALLAMMSWRKWPDVRVDFGLQLYAPWQLSSGKVLYRDVMYLAGGPLSQHFHALMFKLFGVSFTTLIITTLTLLALFMVLLYRVFSKAADQFTALSVCLVTLCVFAFSQYLDTGNYNFVCPYTYETFHGLALSVAGIACLWRWLAVGKNFWALAAGFCAGCVFLTKPDLFLALGAALATALVIHFCGRDHQIAQGWKPVLFLFVGMILPSAVFVLYYSIVWETMAGFKAVAGAWLPLLTTDASQNAYYRHWMGLDAVANHLAAMGEQTAYLLVCVTFLAINARQFWRRIIFSVCLSALTLLLLYLAWARVNWVLCGHALAPFTLATCLFIGRRWWKLRCSPDGQEFVFPLLWSVFALFLLAKMGVFTRFYHYGFYLAMPATALFVWCALWLLPRELKRFDVNPIVFRVALATFITVGVVNLLALSRKVYSGNVFPIGEGHDRMFAYVPATKSASDGVFNALEWIRANTASTDTLAVLPDNVMLNYLSRRTNPTPYTGFSLPEVRAYGETNMLSAYQKNAPDYVVLMHRDPSEYRVGYFGAKPGYGFEMMNWVKSNYTPVWLYGYPPLQTNRFGVEILKRNKTAAR